MSDSSFDCYAILGLRKGANAAEARAAYRHLAKQFHPDAPGGDVERFQSICKAYDAVCQYADAALPKARHHLVSGFWKAAKQMPPPPKNGADVFAVLHLSLEDSLKGASRRVTLKSGKALDVRCPKGCTSGDVIRLKAAGEPGLNGGHAGDALVKIELMEHKRTAVKGRDLHQALWLDLHQLRAGSRVEMRTPRGPLKVKVPPLSSNGRILRLKGLGLPAYGENTNGHLFITLKARRAPSFTDALGRFSRIWTNPLRPTT